MEHIIKNKGITLIALVVTIIVLIILAGVALQLLTGENGLIGKVRAASEETRYRSAEEKVKLAVLGGYNDEGILTCDLVKENIRNTNGYESPIIGEDFTITVVVDGYTFEINGDGSIKDIKPYYITYHLNGGTNLSDAATRYYEGETVILPIPEKEGSAFLGWFKTSDFSDNEISVIGSTEKGDINLYAKWVKETIGDYFEWDTTSGEATILKFSALGLTAYNNGEIKDLVIPKIHQNLKVTKIDNNAFLNHIRLESLIINDNIKSMGGKAFGGCTGIENLTIPISLSTHVSGSGAVFENCTGIKKGMLTKGTGEAFNYTNSVHSTPWYYSRANNIDITIEEGVTRVGDYTFNSCAGLRTVVFPSTLESIGSYAFSKTGVTGGLIFTGKLKTIERGAFSGCKSISSLVLGDSITFLSGNTFDDCTGIENLTIPISLNTYISGQGSAFTNCSGIKKTMITKGTGVGATYTNATYYTPWYYSRANNLDITLEEGIISIGDYTFNGCAGLKTLVFPNTLKSIGRSAFLNSGMSGEIAFPTSLENIEESAFHGCKDITSVIIESTIKFIAGHVFKGCTGMSSLTIPISLNTGAGPNGPSFGDCTGLRKVILTKGTGEGANYSSGGYQPPWYFSRANDLDITLEEGIISIGDYMFRDSTGLKTIEFPSTLESIGKSAFLNSGMSGEIAFPTSLENIEESAFYGCKDITSVIIEDTIKFIAGHVFKGCTGMSSLTIPISLNTGAGPNGPSFGDCTGLRKVILTKGTGEGANYSSGGYQPPWYFSRANELTIIIEKGVSKIGNYTFYSLNTVVFNYTGTQAEWNQISIGINNTSLTSAIINYNYNM